MKKALVILLSIFVVGGAFADVPPPQPTFVWSGNVEGGIAILGGENYDDIVFGVVSPHSSAPGVRAQVQLDAANANRNAGFRAQLRATSGATANLDWNNVSFNETFAWIKPFGDIIEFRAGKAGYGLTGTTVPLGDTNFMDGLGFNAHIFALDILTIGFGTFSTTRVGQGNPWEPAEGGESGLRMVAGVGLDLGIVDVRAQAQFGYEQFDAAFGVRVNALSAFPINAQIRIDNINEFGDEGDIYASAYVGINLIDNLAITLGAALRMDQVDDSDLSMAFGGWAAYDLGNVRLRGDLWYVLGGTYNYDDGFGNGIAVGRGNLTRNSDDSYFSIRPRVEIGVGGNNVWTIGGVFNINTGDSLDGVDYAFFTGVRASF